MARDEGIREEIAGVDWGLVVLDEAHHCRRKLEGTSMAVTQLYRTLDALKDTAFGVLLLTATPMQLDPFELYSLIELVEPGLFEDREDFYEEAFASATSAAR
jgi:SNF2 family DNA or RNA helicase